jgi:hypothetical protein
MRESSYEECAVKPQSAVSLSVVLFSLRLDFSWLHFFESRRNMSCDESHEPTKPEQSRMLFGQIRVHSALAAKSRRTLPNFPEYPPNKPGQSRTVDMALRA